MHFENNKTILLVEDDIIITLTEKKMLETRGYKVVTANCARQAIDICNDNKEIDLILMDIDLGEGMDGTQAAEIILKERQIPVVFLSNHTEPKIVEKTEKITSYGYVVKNSGITVLDACIKMAFKLYEARISEKEKNQALAHSHALMKYIIEHNRSAIAVVDKDLKYIYVSRRYIQDYKIKETDIVGKHHYEIFPALAEKWKGICEMALAGETLSSQEDLFTAEDGTNEWIQWECRPWYESAGTIGGIILYTEFITERKKTGEIIKESETRYKNISGATTDFVFSCVDYSGSGYHIDWMAGAIERITQYKFEELFAKGCWRCIVHPDDTGIFDESVINLQVGDFRSCALRIITKSGIIKWLSVETTCVEAESPHRLRVFGGCTDITEKKAVEEKLRFHDNILQNLSDAVITIDLSLSITSWNRAAEKIYGWSREEAIGKKISFLIRSESPETSEQWTQKELSKADFFNDDLWLRCRNGGLLHIKSQVSPLKDDKGHIIGKIIINRIIADGH